MPLVSIIIPTFNRESTILRTLRSLKNQNFKDFEIIIVDDYSSDNIFLKIESLGLRNLSLIKMADHKGAQVARNVGVKSARGEKIIFLDSDDWWEEGFLKLMLDNMTFTNKKAICCDGYLVDELSGVTKRLNLLSGVKDIKSAVFLRSCVMFQGLLIDRECFEKTGPLDENIVTFHNWDFVLNLISHYEIAYLDKPLFHYVQHSLPSITKNIAQREMGFYQVTQKYGLKDISYKEGHL